MGYNGFCGHCMDQPCSCDKQENKASDKVGEITSLEDNNIGSHAILKNWINCIDTDTYIELYEGDTSVTGLVFGGLLKDLIANKEIMDNYGMRLIAPESVMIDPPGALIILIH